MFSQRKSSLNRGEKAAKNRRALALISGGLDSALAIHLVMEQGIEVIGVHFSSFFSPIQGQDKNSPVSLTAKQLGIPVEFRKKGEDFLEIIKNPKYGHGKNINPCIDCRIYTLKKAMELMDEKEASFLVTGEVVGQRPMSQRKETMRLIEKQADAVGLIVRPLSAKILPPSLPEEHGILDREQFMDIAGRGRKRQLALAERIGLTGYSAPAGGCLLTDQTFSRRLRDLIDHGLELSPEALALLKTGRHIRISDALKVIVSRNETENKFIFKHLPGGPVFEPKDFPGPVAVTQGALAEDDKKKIAAIIRRYSKESTRGAVIDMFVPDGDHWVVKTDEIVDDDWIQNRMI